MPIQEGGRFTPNPNIVSPGVFTRENDLSGVAQGVADIGAAIVAPFPKGPGFSPTLVTSVTDLEAKFGVADGVYYGPYTAKEYLTERGLVTVCRVGGLTGYHQKYPYVIYAVKGTYGRNSTVGTFGIDNDSYLQNPSGSWTSQSVLNGVWAAYDSGSAGASSGLLTMTSMSLVVNFDNGAIAADIFKSPGSGSITYAGRSVTLKFVNETFYVTGSSHLHVLNGGTISDQQTLWNSFASGSMSGSIWNDTNSSIGTSRALQLASVQEDTAFNGAYLVSASFTAESGACSTPLLKISGSISGAFGTYNGVFNTAGSQTYDACSNTWTTQSTTDVKVLAVLADTQNNPVDSNLEASGFSGSTLIAGSDWVGLTDDPPTSYKLVLQPTDSSTPYGTYEFAIDPSSTKYITNVFGKDPRAGDPNKYVAGTKKEAAYLYKVFENAIAAVFSEKDNYAISGSWIPESSVGFLGEPMQFTDDYSLDLTNGDSAFALTNASTPWIVSQKVSSFDNQSNTRFRLFRVLTLNDGNLANTSYKVEISQVKLAGTVSGTDWGSFTLTLRKYNDTDRKPVILEQFPNLSLDPDSSNYIARRIGDRYNYIDYNGKIIEFGNYTNNSRHIRIEMDENPYPTTAVPYGFEAYAVPVNSSLSTWVPPMRYTKASLYGLSVGKYPSGVNFDDAPTGADSELASLYPTASSGEGTADDNKQYFAPLPAFGAYSSVGKNYLFALDEVFYDGGIGVGSAISTTYSGSIPSVYDAANETTYVKARKFVFGFQGGFDGMSPATPINVGGDIIPGNTQGLDCSTSTKGGSIAYKQCIGALGNADEFDINLIAAPGIVHQHHPYVTNLIVDMCETRGDCFFIMDLYVDDGNPTSGQINEVVNYAASYDTNYAAVYYPWVKILDTNTNKIVSVPPSVVLPAVYAQSDRASAEWFAPAGLNRGGIVQAVQVTDRTTHTERDTLYEGKVNPIAAFPGTGIAVWGQKTLQNAASSLDRVSVRRLLINLKKFISSTSKYLLFEQNVASTRNRFLAVVNPYMESVQQRSGLYAFYVKMDDENNTPDIIDRNILYGQIYIKPAKAAEFIVVDFNILPTGATFNGI